MILRPPRSTRTGTLFPYTTLFRSTINRNRESKMRTVSAFTALRLFPSPLAICLHAVYRLLKMSDSTAATKILSSIGRSHRSEEHTYELHSLLLILYDIFSLKKNTHNETEQPE